MCRIEHRPVKFDFEARPEAKKNEVNYYRRSVFSLKIFDGTKQSSCHVSEDGLNFLLFVPSS